MVAEAVVEAEAEAVRLVVRLVASCAIQVWDLLAAVVAVDSELGRLM